MKCPKCQYISFDSGGRCRNCGYDFSLSTAAPEPPPDLQIQNGTEPIGPLSELSLRDSPAGEYPAESDARIDASRPITSSLDLPLFRDRALKQPDPPLVAPGPSRAPLAVRRATAAAPRPRPRRIGAPDEADPEPRLALDTAELPVASARAVPSPGALVAADEDASAPVTAPAGARILAALVDVMLIGGIDVTVVYFTLKICELTVREVGALPLAPLLAFLALLDGGYFSIFVAAGGQTIGKMAAGVRVIPSDRGAAKNARVPFGRAVVRAAAYLASALPAGLGFLPGLFGDERRALHDRLAETRVVKA